MTITQVNELFDIVNNCYKGTMMSKTDFSMFRELQLFKGLAFDQMKGDDYEVWVVVENLNTFLKRGIVTTEELAHDIGFIGSYLTALYEPEEAAICTMNTIDNFYSCIELGISRKDFTEKVANYIIKSITC